MSRIIGNRCASHLRAILISGVFGCAVQACDTGEPPGGTGAPAAGAEDITTLRRAATGTICDPNPAVPCITTFNGRTLHNLKIVNLFMSSDWDSDNSGTPFTRQAINDFTQRLVNNANSYFSFASTDYENAGHSVSFGGAFDATGVQRVVCPTPSLGGITDAISIHAWITCLTAPGPIPLTLDDLGIRSTIGNIPQPDDSTLYVIYVPVNTNIVDAIPIAGGGEIGKRTCGDFGGYHFWQENGRWQFGCGLNCHDCVADFCAPVCCLVCTPGCLPTIVDQTFAYVVMPVECAKDGAGARDFDVFTQNVTHEIVEAAVDPIVPTGWVDRGKAVSIFSIFDVGVLDKGEISDICLDGVHNPSSVALSDGTSVSTYWSTSQNACVPRPVVVAKCQDVTVPTAANSCSAPASVNNGSSDPTGGVLTINQNPAGPYGLGTTTVTLTATSSTGGMATCTGHVTVQDKTPPALTVPGPVTAVEGTTPNLGTATATDLCPGAVTITNNAPASFPIGVTTVTWTARDAAGNTTTGTQTVTITCAGGPSSCADGHTCQTNDDCGSRVCTNLLCAPPACAPRCNRGALCGANADCGSQVCVGSTCRAPACSPRCLQGAICGDNGDCSSFVCSSTNRCAPSSCSPNCNQGAPCGSNNDCLARRCLNGQCAPPTCSPNCASGALCNNNGDCSSHICNVNRCR
jgi:hypothetical protein